MVTNDTNKIIHKELSYQITGFGGHAACLNISHIYSLPDFAKNQTAMTVEKPGLYFIGEVMDVTGQLGGYNLHWAWASGYAAGQYA